MRTRKAKKVGETRIINYQKQNGKSGIFWQQDKKQKPDKKFSYRSKVQNYSIRKHPQNFDNLEFEEEQILTLGGKDKENEKKKPEKNFVARNRNLVTNKSKKKKESSEESGTVTLTQAQLNAILASVGKVASGKEDNLRISIDSTKNEIKIESPRKSKEPDYDRYSDHHSDTEDDKYSTHKHRNSRKQEKKEDTIFSLIDEPTERNRREDEKKNKKRKEYKLFDDEEDAFSSYKEKRDMSRERRRERSREREKHKKRYPSRSRERDISRDREREHSREGSRERDLDRKKRKDKINDDELNDRNRVKDRGRDEKSERRKREDRDVDRNRDREKYRSKDSEKGKTKETESEKEEMQPEKAVVKSEVTPREIVGIPFALPWKHMTKAERRRLMLARMQAEDTVKEAGVVKLKLEEDRLLKEKEREESKEYDRKRAEKKARDERKERDKREREINDERERERRWEESKERDYRREKEDRKDDSRERRDRRHRDKSQERERRHHRDDSRERIRSPAASDDYHTSNERHESKKEVVHLPPAGPKALTLAEKKRQQWEQERKEQEKRYDPWGRPGAGAPIRTRSGNIAADYRSRQEETIRMSYEHQEENSSHNKHYQEENSHPTQSSQQNVPAAMRSSFVIGEIAPDAGKFANTKEIARRQWLEDLERQMEEKKQAQIRETVKAQTVDTWADKFSSSKPVTYQPDSPRDTGRVSSAPQPDIPDQDQEEDRTHIRGQNVYMDPVTRKELEEKRKRLLEHQKAVMEQVQEKQLIKQRERERKIKEDMEEERKLQAERDRLQRQFEQEQMKVKMKEARRQQEVEQLKTAMDEAHEQAMREKMARRMEHLEKGGHDVSQLKATLQEDPRTGRYPATGRLTGRELMPEYASHNLAKMSPRGKVTTVAPTHIPGLDLDASPRGGTQAVTKFIGTDRAREMVTDGAYTENRILTPSQHRATHRSVDSHYPRREFGTQTGMRDHSPIDDISDKQNTDVELQKILDLASNREDSEIEIMYKGRRVRVKSAPKVASAPRSKHKVEPPKSGPPKARRGENKEKPIWNFQNKKHKKPVKQSEKDLNFNEKRKHSEMRRLKRERELLALVDLNRDIIPTEKKTPGNSRSHSPVSDRGGHTPRGRETVTLRRSKSYSPENGGTQKSARSQSPPTNRQFSPPVPALRYRPDQPDERENQSTDRSRQRYYDRDPLDVPFSDGDFIPFTRTVEILDPARASSPLQVSREATRVTDARKAYIKGMKPADYGKKVNPYKDRMRVPGERETPNLKDPILNPALVTDHPTQRQDAILQQLSSLKMNLMQRQRELETFSPTDFE